MAPKVSKLYSGDPSDVINVVHKKAIDNFASICFVADLWTVCSRNLLTLISVIL